MLTVDQIIDHEIDFVLHCDICGEQHELPRNSTAELHPHVLEQLELTTSSELQRILDQYQVIDFFDEHGNYIGPDGYGVGLDL